MRRPLQIDFSSAVLWTGLLLLAAGDLGGRFQPARLVLTAGLLGSVFLNQKLHNSNTPVIQQFMITAGIWLGWGCLSLMWTPNPVRGVSELNAILFGFLTAFGIICLSRSAGVLRLNTLRRGWIAAVLVTLPIAAWELATGRHLPLAQEKGGSMVAGGPGIGYVRFSAASFANRNDYVAFLLLAFPALLWWFDRARSTWKTIPGIFLLAIGGLVVISASRLGLLVLVIDTFLWLALAKPGRSKIPVRALIGVVLVAGLGTYAVINASFTQRRILEAFSGHDSSVNSRRALAYNALILTERSYGLGVGAAGFASSMLRPFGLYKTYDGNVVIRNAHNLLLEIMASYGVLVFVLFVAWLLRCWVVLWRGFCLARRSANHELEIAFVAGLTWLAGMPAIFAIHGSLLTITMMWASLGTIGVLAHLATRFKRGLLMDKSQAVSL